MVMPDLIRCNHELLDDTDKQQMILDLYRAGWSYHLIAQGFKMILDLHRAGWSYHLIAQGFKETDETIRQILVRNNEE